MARKNSDPNPRAAKLTACSVRNIRRLHALGVSKRAIARIYHVSPTCVTLVVERATWRHVSDNDAD